MSSAMVHLWRSVALPEATHHGVTSRQRKRDGFSIRWHDADRRFRHERIDAAGPNAHPCDRLAPRARRAPDDPDARIGSVAAGAAQRGALRFAPMGRWPRRSLFHPRRGLLHGADTSQGGIGSGRRGSAPPPDAADAAPARRGAAVWLGALAAAGIVVWSLTPWFAALYPPHEFWVMNPANAARRWTQVCLCALALLAIEQRMPGSWRGSAAARFVEVFATSSLAGYFFHEMLLFFRVFGFSFEARWGKSCSWPQYAVLTILLAACTFVLTWMTARIYAAVEQRATAAAA